MLLYVGLAAVGLCSAAFAAEVVPTLRRCWRNRTRVRRTGTRVKTHIYMRDSEDGDE